MASVSAIVLSQIKEALTNWAAGVAGIVAVSGLGSITWYFSLYHKGWFLSYAHWMFVPVLLAIGSFVIGQTRKGFWWLLGIAIALSIAFAILYGQSWPEHGGYKFLPDVAFALYLIVISLSVGIITFLVKFLLTLFSKKF